MAKILELTKAELNRLVAVADEAIADACLIADELGESFYFADLRYVGKKNPNGYERLTIDDYLEDNTYRSHKENYQYEGDREYSGWQSSSTFC